MLKKYSLLATLIILPLNTTIAHASVPDKRNIMFSWTEQQYPQYLSPAGQSTQTWGVWHYRFYPDTGIYLGVNDLNQVHVMGGEFGNSPLFVATMEDLLSTIPADTGFLIDSGSANCVTESLIPVGTVMNYEKLPILTNESPTDITSVGEDVLGQFSLPPGAQADALAQLADIGGLFDSLQLDQNQEPAWTETITVLESTTELFSSESDVFHVSQAAGVTVEASTHTSSTTYTEIVDDIWYLLGEQASITDTARTFNNPITNPSTLPANAIGELLNELFDGDAEPIVLNSELDISYTLPVFSGPVESCVGMSWYTMLSSPTITGTQEINGISSPADLAGTENIGLLTNIAAINETITTPAGTFNSIRTQITAANEVHVIWTSIEHGVLVKLETYIDGNLERGKQLVSLTLP